MSVVTCSVYADVYQGVIEEVTFKQIKLSYDASKELKRAIFGAQLVVDLSKFSVATDNEDLLTTRPSLSSMSSTNTVRSNACEACLRLIAGLETAAKELDEELDALEDEGEEN
ncbi:hypothetical protein BG000_009239 [Podila horticola]|nr:hypothetical protein BG000_009239 [Podila horticola]